MPHQVLMFLVLGQDHDNTRGSGMFPPPGDDLGGGERQIVGRRDGRTLVGPASVRSIMTPLRVASWFRSSGWCEISKTCEPFSGARSKMLDSHGWISRSATKLSGSSIHKVEWSVRAQCSSVYRPTRRAARQKVYRSRTAATFPCRRHLFGRRLKQGVAAWRPLEIQTLKPIDHLLKRRA